MLIESIIQREGGTTIELDKATYRFAPNEAGAHVCEVKEGKHIGRLLSITEGFRLYEVDETPATVDLASAGAAAAAAGFDTPEGPGDEEPESEELEGESAQLVDEVPEGAEVVEGPVTAELDRDALAAQYEEKFGKKPHHRANAETILEALKAAE